MLKALTIQNFAIIDYLSVSFVEGLNVISGETGAGKSIIIGAVGLLLGDRASVDIIRSSEDAATIEALFDIRGKEMVKEKLKGMGMMGYDGDDELIVKRIVSRTGKNKIYINGNLATLGLLTSLSESLVNICSQHEHQSMLNADNHIDVLDEFGNLTQLRDEFSQMFEQYQSLRERYRELGSINRQKQEREEFLSFQLQEIEEGHIAVGEDVTLQEEKKVVTNAKKLGEYARESHDILYAGEGSVLENLSRVLRGMKEISLIDTKFDISPADLEAIYFNLEEVAFALRDYKNRVIFDPERLEQIENRLEYLGRLKRKHGGTLDDVLRKRDAIKSELEAISSVESELARLAGEIAEKKKVLLERSDDLSGKRAAVADILKKEMEREIHTLRMEDTTFDIRFYKPKLDHEGDPTMDAKGIDSVEFYLSTNIGEALKPVNRVASGGELSRIVLAMKKVLARTGSVSTIIFDEVDTGIGGATAEIVGKKLQEVSDHHQVICISHLPQIVCFGDQHFLVSKHVSGERTKTEVRVLSEAERLDEITRMLGGVQVTEKTREHANEMLKASHNKQ